MKTSSNPKRDVGSRLNQDATARGLRFPRAGAVAIGLLALFIAQAPVWASPGVFEPLSGGTGSKVNLGLDSRMAGRLLADSKGLEGGGAADTETPKAMDKPDEVKLTVTKGSDIKRPAEPEKKDSFAFVKDWPFWVIVGGVVVAGAATYMIVRNSNQPHACLADTFNAGCFGAK
jgi:hypothetical protein